MVRLIFRAGSTQLAEAKPADTAAARPAIRRIEVRELLNGQREAVLVHAGDEYRLRITSKDKLILTK
jgi:hemin uptake protein HemP